MDLGARMGAFLVPNSRSVANATENFNLMAAHAEPAAGSAALRPQELTSAPCRPNSNHHSFADNPKRDRTDRWVSRLADPNDASRSVQACPAARWRGQFQSETRSRIMHGP